jgi:hypothetical protein
MRLFVQKGNFPEGDFAGFVIMISRTNPESKRLLVP